MTEPTKFETWAIVEIFGHQKYAGGEIESREEGHFCDIGGLQRHDRTPKVETHAGVMYGKEGLKQQMEDLRDQHEFRNTLVRYLTMRAQGADWEDKFKSALVRFLAESTDVAIFGILIRDAPPNKSDLRSRSKNIAKKHPAKMHIELLAIYLPVGSISILGTKFAPAGSKTNPTVTGVKKKTKKKGGK